MPELVQPIAVQPTTHEATVMAAALASATMLGHALLKHTDHETQLSRLSNDEVWDQWLAQRFTKSVRRMTKSAALRKVESLELTSTTIDAGCARATAFEPMSYDELPRELSRLQVSGTDCERIVDRGERYERTGAITPLLVINQDVTMSTGKTAAQAAHGLGLWLLAQDTETRALWVSDPGAALVTDDISRVRSVVTVTDSGLTEIPPGTVTVAVTTP